MLKTIKGYSDTAEAAKVTTAIEQRHAGAALFAQAASAVRVAPQAPKL